MINVLKFILNTVFDVAKDTAGAGFAHQILEIFSVGKVGKEYQRIKESSDEDNNLFTQLLSKIYLSCLTLIGQGEYLKMKGWFIATSLFSRHKNNNYFLEIFQLLPEKYLETMTEEERSALKVTAKEINTDIKYLILSPLFGALNGIEDSKTSFIKSSFYDSLSEKNNPELAVTEYVSENPLININQANQVYHAWGNFCDNLEALLKDEKNKKRLYSYKQSYSGRAINKVAEDFLNDFMNCIANQIKMETSGDTTGKLLTEETPIFVWLKKWLQLTDEEKIVNAVSIIKTPQSFADNVLEKIDSAKKKMKEVDERWAEKTVQPGGLVHSIEELRKIIRN